MIIVNAEYNDLPEILDLQYLAFQREVKQYNDFSIQPLKQTLEEIKKEFEKYVFIKAIDNNGSIIGSARGHVKDGTSYVCTVIVHPTWQGQGVGTKLIETIEKLCSAPRYEINASTRCPLNIKLYERLGYIRFRETQTHDNGFIYLEKYPAK